MRGRRIMRWGSNMGQGVRLCNKNQGRWPVNFLVYFFPVANNLLEHHMLLSYCSVFYRVVAAKNQKTQHHNLQFWYFRPSVTSVMTEMTIFFVKLAKKTTCPMVIRAEMILSIITRRWFKMSKIPITSIHGFRHLPVPKRLPKARGAGGTTEVFL